MVRLLNSELFVFKITRLYFVRRRCVPAIRIHNILDKSVRYLFFTRLRRSKVQKYLTISVGNIIDVLFPSKRDTGRSTIYFYSSKRLILTRKPNENCERHWSTRIRRRHN